MVPWQSKRPSKLYTCHPLSHVLMQADMSSCVIGETVRWGLWNKNGLLLFIRCEKLLVDVNWIRRATDRRDSHAELSHIHERQLQRLASRELRGRLDSDSFDWIRGAVPADDWHSQRASEAGHRDTPNFLLALEEFPRLAIR